MCKALYQNDALSKLERIKRSFANPEEINDNPETAPSKRILKIFSGYQKVLHGPTIAKRIGIENIRTECPHFHEWLDWLENLH